MDILIGEAKRRVGIDRLSVHEPTPAVPHLAGLGRYRARADQVIDRIQDTRRSAPDPELPSP